MSWSELQTSGLSDVAPSPRSAHVAAAFRDRYLLIFGGGSVAHCYNDLHVLDVESGTWEAVAVEGVPPSPRAGTLLPGGETGEGYAYITLLRPALNHLNSYDCVTDEILAGF